MVIGNPAAPPAALSANLFVMLSVGNRSISILRGELSRWRDSKNHDGLATGSVASKILLQVAR